MEVCYFVFNFSTKGDNVLNLSILQFF